MMAFHYLEVSQCGRKDVKIKSLTTNSGCSHTDLLFDDNNDDSLRLWSALSARAHGTLQLRTKSTIHKRYSRSESSISCSLLTHTHARAHTHTHTKSASQYYDLMLEKRRSWVLILKKKDDWENLMSFGSVLQNVGAVCKKERSPCDLPVKSSKKGFVMVM